MSNIHHSITELIGHTPLLELTNYEKENNLQAEVVVKLEYFNPNQSVKDRIANAMIEDAEKEDCFIRAIPSLKRRAAIPGLGWLLLLQPKTINSVYMCRIR